MSSASQTKDATQIRDVESLIAAIKELVNLLDCVVLSGVAWPEVSGVLSVDGETYRDVLPLGDGVHIVLSVGDLPTKLVGGMHEIEVQS